MKYFILGCNGMVGHTVSLYLAERGHNVIGFGQTPSSLVESIVGDARDGERLRKIIEKENFDTVVNCLGILNQFAEIDKAQATYLNAYLPHFLADITKDTDTQIIHKSTDCVFSGKKGAYTEDDLRDSESFYGRSKALGELDDGKNLTMRTSLVGPDIDPNGIGLLNWFMRQKGKINGYTKAMWSGQTTLQLAKLIEKASLERVHGLYNTVPDYSISKYELLMLMNKHLRNNSVDIEPIEGVNADKSLVRGREGFDCKIPDYETMIAEMTEWILAHKKLYPHYNLGGNI